MPHLEPKYSKRFVNVDKAYQTGFEFKTQFALYGPLDVKIVAYYTMAENLDWSEPLSEVPPFESLFELIYTHKKFTSSVSGRFVAEQKRIAKSFGEKETPGFSVFDWKTKWKVSDKFYIGMSVLNIFDRNYYEHLNRSFRNMPESSVLWEPGRNIVLEAGYKF